MKRKIEIPTIQAVAFVSRMLRLMVAIVLATWIGSAGIGRADDTPVAVGDGFEVTVGDVERLQEYFEARSIYSTDREYRRVALQYRLFSEEAKALGLVQGSEGTAEKEETVEGLIKLSNLYIAKILEDYPLNGVVIESYYRAHPDKFREGHGSSADLGFRPLDATLKKEIRQKILAAKKRRISDNAFERLKKKYHVRLCDPESKECK